MKVYVLELVWPKDGSLVVGAYTSREKAEQVGKEQAIVKECGYFVNECEVQE